MLKKLYLVVMALSVFLLSCSQHEDSDHLNVNKTDLSKAAMYNVQLGLGYLKQGDRPRAKKKLLIALAQEPKSADVNSAMAYFFEQTNELDQAEKYYVKALALSGRGGAQLNNYGAFLCRQGNYKKAESYFLKAVAELHYINTATAYENAGLCALSVHQNTQATQFFIKALEQDPSRKVSFYELLKLETQAGKNTEAYTLIKNHPELILNDKVLLAMAKDIAAKTGHYDVATSYEHIITNLEPNLEHDGVDNEYNNNA